MCAIRNIVLRQSNLTLFMSRNNKILAEFCSTTRTSIWKRGSLTVLLNNRMCLRFSSALIAFCAQVCTSIFSSCFSLLLLLEGEGKGRREEGATIGKNCTKKWRSPCMHILSFGKISLLARLFYPFFSFLQKKWKKKYSIFLNLILLSGCEL